MTRSSPAWRSARIVTILVAVSLLLAIGACDRRQDSFTERDIADNNRGVALMGYFDYPGAHDTFQDLVERRPDWSDARVNLAVATLNRQQEGDEEKALEILAQVLADDPQHLRARYMSGLLFLYQGATAESLAALEAVAAADPEDAYASYFIAQNLVQEGRLDAALEWYERAMRTDSYLRSAYYGAALAHRRLGQREDAAAMLQAYERLKDNPRARLAEFKYTRMGPRAEAVAIGVSDVPRSSVPVGALFAEAVKIPLDVPIDQGGSLTLADVDGQGSLDVFVAAGSGTLLLEGGDDGSLVAAVDHPLSGIPGTTAAAWGDIDNDRDVDVYLCREGPNQLWLRDGSEWLEAGGRFAVDDDGACSDAAMVDADHDGDLDIFVVNSDGPDELFNNNRDGSFRRLAQSQGIAGGAAGRQFLAADLDHDRDVDIVVINEDAPHNVWINDRLWAYREDEGAAAFMRSDIRAATAADLDADGRVELYALAPDGGVTRWQPVVGSAWTEESIAQEDIGSRGGLSVADVNGDGTQELVISTETGFIVLPSGGTSASMTDEGGLGSLARPALMNPARGPSMIAVGGDGSSIVLWPPGPGRFDSLGLSFGGMEEEAESMRSNSSGIGTRAAVRNLDKWTVAWMFDAHSGPGQSLQPVSIGLAGRPTADFVAIDWSDGVFQTELDLDAGVTHRITETQRQLSSCPVLFAWDGQRFRFVSDVLGVGGLGFLVRPGLYSTPRPWEFFLLPEAVSRPREGRYVLKITEPMEENAYLDSVRLHVVDLPPGWAVVPDERMATGDPAVTGRFIYYRRFQQPTGVTNDRGQDVAATVAVADQQAAPVGHLDKRFIGRLENTHRLTLEFDEVINPAGTRPVLVADGWVEYPYSQTVFAAWQASETYDPVSLEARNAAGEWTLVYPAFGYPAGMPRKMALPLDELPPRTTALRLSTNLEVYWDRLGIAYEEDLPKPVRRALDPIEARLAKTGFPLRTTGEQRLPGYDYERRQAFWDARYLDGAYTRLGPVMPLLAETDDAVAIVGSGEELHLEFPAPTDALPDGWTRRLILETRGWAKDMDLYTRDGGQVGPLPRRPNADPADDPKRERLHATYNTRFQGGR